MADSLRAKTAQFDAYRDSYGDEVQSSIAFAGQEHEFFVRQKVNRLLEIAERQVGAASGLSFLDVGCGVGLADRFLGPHVGTLDGADVSSEAVERAATDNPDARYRSYETTLPYDDGSFDVVFTMSVVHHVPPAEWQRFAKDLARVTKPGGLVVVFEHNPLNPLTRLAVSRCAFDEDAVLVTRRKVSGLLRAAALNVVEASYIIFFTRSTPLFDRLERRLAWLPLGAQHVVAARREA